MSCARSDDVVPLSVERFAMEVDLRQFRVGHFHAGRIGICVQSAGDAQSRGGMCSRNQIYHYFVAYQGSSAPVLSNVGEQSMLYLVPFARARREVTDADREASLIGQALQFPFPQPGTRTVATTSISGNQQPHRLGVAGMTHLSPPAPNALRRELGGIMIRPYIYPTGTLRQVIDAIGRNASQLGFHEVMDLDGNRLALALPFPPLVRKLAHQFFLLGVHRNDRLAFLLICAHFDLNMAKLSITIRVIGTLQTLTIGLQAVAHIVQQVRHLPWANPKTERLQFTRKLPYALRGPAQRRFWVSPCRGLKELFERLAQTLGTEVKPQERSLLDDLKDLLSGFVD